ncbi:MAG: hypothetical protein KF883_17130 [Thermomicrobiales bacterium]|nr:hypothetical protein [Thermomicrobiales bacterium]
MSFLDEDAPEESSIAPEDVASAARGCQAILVMLVIIAVMLCVAAVYYYGT